MRVSAFTCNFFLLLLLLLFLLLCLLLPRLLSFPSSFSPYLALFSLPPPPASSPHHDFVYLQLYLYRFLPQPRARLSRSTFTTFVHNLHQPLSQHSAQLPCTRFTGRRFFCNFLKSLLVFPLLGEVSFLWETNWVSWGFANWLGISGHLWYVNFIIYLKEMNRTFLFTFQFLFSKEYFEGIYNILKACVISFGNNKIILRILII